MKYFQFFTLSLLLLVMACSKKGQLDMQTNRNTLNLNDTLKIDVSVKNVSTLIIDFGDSTTRQFPLSGAAQEISETHVYSDTGSYILGAFAFTDKSAYSKRVLIKVEP